jgi:hypothetical protein
MIERCHEVAGREEIFHVHDYGLIEDGLHLLVVCNGHVQEILVLWGFPIMRCHFVSSVEHNSMHMFNKEVICKAHHEVCLQLLLVHHDGTTFAMK